MGHSVSKAADNAVKKGEKTKTADRTPEQIIADIRRNLASNLAVTPNDQRFLLAQYDEQRGERQCLSMNTETKLKEMQAASLEAMQIANAEIERLKALNASQSTMIVELQAKNEEFRTVYEMENRSQSLKVERIEPLAATPTLTSSDIGDGSLAGSGL